MINQKGQLSLFMAVMFVFFLTMVAFVINVGLFVKAKINLQNAVDAAAWSGAAVQARQLTDISYLNLEMRNVYKEWMAKYYILGNHAGRSSTTPAVVDFRLTSIAGSSAQEQDRYNLPSICIDFGSAANYCKLFYTPGIPRIPQGGLLSILDNATEELEETIIGASTESCQAVGNLNLKTAQQWAFGTGEEDLSQLSNFSRVALDRPGAWVKALELAVRIRNLESMVNLKPYDTGVCLNTSSSNCETGIQSIQPSPSQERIAKAYYSAYRNLGNNNKDLKENFVLTELAPREVNYADSNNLSSLLIPGDNSLARSKYYLDLKLIPLNLATFFTFLTPRSITDNGSQLPVDSRCEAIKIAFPVPAYPFGFNKNPKVLTYYSVKGEATFKGLFNPFQKTVKLVAYASAKPFGGRIGPHLFDTFSEPQAVKPRATSTGELFRSSAYVMGLTPGPAITTQGRVDPVIPQDSSIWVQSSNDVIGGTINSGGVKYSVPNLLYFAEENPNFTQDIHTIQLPGPLGSDTTYQIGLYKSSQLTKFKEDFGITTSTQYSSTFFTEAFERIRSPNRYDAHNYLVPTSTQDNQNNQLNFYGNPNQKLIVYAPLFGSNLAYESLEIIVNEAQNYLTSQESSIQAFTDALEGVKDAIVEQNQNTAGSVGSSYLDAAEKIHDDPYSCNSMAGQFTYFFLGDTSNLQDLTDCDPGSSLKEGRLSKYFNKFLNSNEPVFNPLYYYSPTPLNSLTAPDLSTYSAFFPGEYNGGTNDASGAILNPFRAGEPSKLSRRNFYSTKLISFQTIFDWNQRPIPLYHEGKIPPSETYYTQIDNPLENQGELQEVFQ